MVPGQMVALDGLPDIDGTVLKLSVAAVEVAAGVQVPDTIHLYWKLFMVLGAAVRFIAAVVTVE